MQNWRTLLFVAAALVMVLAGCAAPSGDVLIGNYNANLSLAEQADVTIDIPLENAYIDVINTNGINVLEARVEYLGAINFTVEGESTRVVSLTEDTQGKVVPEGRTLDWELRLTNRVPVDLKLSMGTGNVTGNLSRMVFTGLDLTQGTGTSNLILPSSPFDLRTVTVNGGEMTLVPGRGAQFEVAAAVNSGALHFGVANGVPVIINVVEQGEGVTISMPETFVQAQNAEGQTVYQSPEYVEGSSAMVINLTITGGEFTVNLPPQPQTEE